MPPEPTPANPPADNPNPPATPPADPAPAPSPAPEPAPAPTPAPTDAPAALERPEGLPDDFWDAKANQPKLPELTQRLNDLTARDAELQSLRAQAPEKPDGYKVELPENFELPEGFEFKPDADNPLTKPVMEWAHKHNLSQTAFAELVGLQAKAQADAAQADKEFYDKEDAERLGERAPQRRKATETWIDAKLASAPKEVRDFGKQMLRDPIAVLLFEHAMSLTAGPTTQRSGAEGAGAGKDISHLSPSEREDLANRKAMELAGVKMPGT